MPFIFCDNNSRNAAPPSALERFHLLIEKYKSIVESNATARCMVGFTAASFIRNEGDIDIDSLETWLQSMERDLSFPLSEGVDQSTSQVERILNVVMSSAAEYTSDEYDTEEDDDSGTNDISEEGEDEFEAENKEVYELNRFVSRDPYSPLGSYPLYTYHSRGNTTKESDDNLIQFTSAYRHFESY